MIAECDLAIGFGHAEPVTCFAKVGQGFFGKVACYWVLVQFSVNACKGAVDNAGQVRQLVFLRLLQCFLKKRDRFWLVGKIVIGDGKLRRYSDLRFIAQPFEDIFILERPDDLKRFLISADGFKRK
jgi:hypothetical protein